jgi:hypothetical protein
MVGVLVFVKLSGAEPFGLSTVEGDWGSGGIVIGFCERTATLKDFNQATLNALLLMITS